MNPFREDLLARSLAEPCTIVIFGASGDLTHRKLIPALYNLAVDGELPTGTRIIGFARRPITDEAFHDGLAASNRQVSRSGHDERVGKPFIATVHYHAGEFANDADYRSLAEKLDAIDHARGGAGNRLFYIAAAPESFEPILVH